MLKKLNTTDENISGTENTVFLDGISQYNHQYLLFHIHLKPPFLNFLIFENLLVKLNSKESGEFSLNPLISFIENFFLDKKSEISLKTFGLLSLACCTEMRQLKILFI